MTSVFQDEVVEQRKAHPFDQIIGEKVNDYIQQNTGGSTIGLTFQQFKDIDWPNKYPYFVCDLLETMSGFSMSQELQDRENRKFDEDRDNIINGKIKQEREKSGKINTEKVRELLMKEHLTDKEKKLEELSIMITESVYNKLWRFFNFVKHNVNEKNQSKCYMTKESLKLNLKKYFGHKTTFLDARLYSVLSDGQVNRRLYFDQFIEKFYIPLFEKPPIVKANFMFKMLDFDGDNYLHASDLVEAQEIIDELSDFGEEL